MIDAIHEKFRRANDPSSTKEELLELMSFKDELIDASIALNKAADREVLSLLEHSEFESVRKNLLARYCDLPELYTISMREVSVTDAEYIFGLRVDNTYNKYISKVSNDLNQQGAYIESYINGNKNHISSLYFIIENKDKNVRCGTVRIYNFKGNSFEWGSWILDENKTRYAAMETAIFVYEFAFKNLGFSKSEFEVNKLNEKVVSYHLKSGAKIVSEDDINYYFRINKDDALEFTATLKQRLESKTH